MKKQTLIVCLVLVIIHFTMVPMFSQDAYIGEIRMFAGNFVPENWELCDGRLLPISQYQTLFAVIYNFYGGDGRSNFALPDLRGRFPMQAGTGRGLTPHKIGEYGGSETSVISPAQLPTTGTETVSSDTGKSHGKEVTLPGANINKTQAHLDKMPPYLSINFIICTRGIFPPRK